MKLNKIMMAGAALVAGLAFTSCQTEALDPNPLAGTEVTLASFGPSMLERMDTMQIFGTKLDQVSKVVFVNAEVEKSAFINASAEVFSVVIPDESRPGEIGLVAGKDTIWSKTPLVFAEPIEVKELSPATDIMPGTKLTIKGDYVYNIASIEFQVGQIVKAADFVKCERRELEVMVPVGAVSGDIVFTDGADWVQKVNAEMLSAAYLSMSADSLDFGETLTITGANLNLVEKVVFAGNVEAQFTVAADNASMTVAVPADAAPGVITMTQYSLLALTTDTLKLPVLSVADVTPTSNIDEGMVITVTGKLLDRVTRIEVGGGASVLPGDFTLNATNDTIKFAAPAGMNDGKIKLIQNANLYAETALVKMRKKGNVFQTLSTPFELGTSWGNWFQVAYGNDNQQLWRTVITEPGKITVNVEWTDGDYHQVQWQQVLDTWSYIGQVDLAEGQTSAQFVVDQAIVDQIQTGNGIVFGGYAVNILSFEWESASAPVALWEGDAEVNWNNAVTIASADVLANAGKTLYITYNATDGDYHMIRIINSSWGFNPEGDDNWNLSFGAGESGVWEKAISDELITNLAGGDLSLTGFGCHITKVAVK